MTKWEMPVVGKEYYYLGTIVKVTRIVPLRNGEPEEATVYFETRFCDYGSCEASELTPRQKG